MRFPFVLVAVLALSSCASAADTPATFTTPSEPRGATATGLTALGASCSVSRGVVGGCGQQVQATQAYGIGASNRVRVTIRERIQSRPRLFSGRGCR